MEEQIEAVQRTQDYIEDHLTDNITLSKLAEVSFFSPWYSYRLFVQHVGMTPADYIRRLRLSKSALRLRDAPCKIIDIALELGFGSVDGYQRAFFLNVCMENGKYPAAMMVKELIRNRLDGRKWFYYDSPVMAISKEEAQKYDDTLEKMEKRHQPSQEEFYILSHAFIDDGES